MVLYIHTCKCCASLFAIQPVAQTDFCLPEHTWQAYGSQKTDGGWFSPFTMRFPGIKLRSTGLQQAPLPTELFHQPVFMSLIQCLAYPGWPQTCYITQGDLELLSFLPLSTKVYAITLSLCGAGGWTHAGQVLYHMSYSLACPSFKC